MSLTTAKPSSFPLGREAHVRWRAATVGWVAGVYLVILGMARLILTLRAAEPYLGAPWLRGALSVVGGLLLLTAACAAFPTPVQRLVQLLAVAPQVLFGLVFLRAGLYATAATLLIVALGVTTAAFATGSRTGPQTLRQRGPDLAALMLALMVVSQALDLLMRGQAAGATPPGFPLSPQTVGAVLLFGGLAVIVVQALEGSSGALPRGLVWAVHLLAGAAVVALWGAQSLVLGGSAWMYGAAAVLRGLALASMPLLSDALARLDPHSLRPRLILTLVLLAALPVMIALVLVVDVAQIGNEDAARQVAFGVMLLTTLGAAIAGVWLSARLVRPLQLLVNDVDRIAAGARSQALNSEGPTEVRRLAQAVGQMAHALDIRAAERERLAQAAAVTEERQRLARDLHDSVSQTVTAITFSTYSALTNWESKPQTARQRVEQVRDLAKRAQAEMRALIFELRPDQLEVDGLVKALELQAGALAERGLTEPREFAVDVALCEEPPLPLSVKEVFYRIAQEALHNAAKHARPTRITLTLVHAGKTVMLIVADDGKGFDAEANYPGHLGLRSMRERAERVGASCTIESGPNGSVVRVQYRLA